MIGKPRRSKLFIFTLGSLLLGIFTDCGACILFAQAVGQSVPPPQAPNSSSNETTPPPVSVPEVLRSWIPWSLYDEGIKRSPSTYRNQEERIHFWPSQVDIAVDDKQGTWKVPVQVFYESWVPLPGGGENWPTQVTDGVKELVVIERNGFPSVKLKPGTYLLQGTWKWEKVPQRMILPKSYGWVRLQLNNEPVAAPTWDENGYLWFKRAVSDEVSKDQYSFQIYRLIEDGSPIWLRTEIDLTATGRSREEELGYVLPEGWQLSYVNSSIPVAIEESGRIKVQLRAGNWKIQIDAFRNDNFKEIRFGAESPPALESELIALRTAPGFRTVELQGVVPVDVQMTRFPTKWRELSVFEWKTDLPFQVVEKTRGMGIEKPNHFTIQRSMWLDDDGNGITYEDTLRVESKQATRLNVAEDHQLGAVRVDKARQLITENSANGSHGIELRLRSSDIEAVGRAKKIDTIHATGWQIPADSLQLLFYLPPGWRMFALLGPDRVDGAWLTAWTLLDLFLLLVLTLAVMRLYGILPGVIALLAFGLTYHEPGSPRWTWFFLLIPVALLKIIGSGIGSVVGSTTTGTSSDGASAVESPVVIRQPLKHAAGLNWWRNIALVILMINFIPFCAMQIQNAIYPQLEPSFIPSQREMFQWRNPTSNSSSDLMANLGEADYPLNRPGLEGRRLPRIADEVEETALLPYQKQMRGYKGSSSNQQAQSQVSNLQYDPKTNIQTGVARPKWVGNAVSGSWSGPVAAEETIRPILISCTVNRILTVIRLLTSVLLLAILLGATPSFRLLGKGSRLKQTPLTAIILLCCFFCGSPATAQIPDEKLLETLKERMGKGSDAFPHAADIPEMRLKLVDNQLEIEGVVHAATQVAVPLPGKLPSWFPRRVQVDGLDAIVTQRTDGFLWVLVPEGIHRLQIEGRILDSAEWVWAFALNPRHLTVEAPEWTWTGLSNEGILNAQGGTGSQVIFARKEEVVNKEVNYDRKNYRSAFLVERRLEIGLAWKVFTQVKRLSEPGKAVSVNLPLLEGEQLTTPGLIVKDGSIDINLGAEEMSATWQSEIPIRDSFTLKGTVANNVVERWTVETSPVWSMQYQGGFSILDPSRPNFVPMWYPWPGETVELRFQRPVAVPGKVVTTQGIVHRMILGGRRRESKLWFEVESSLGGEQAIELPVGATVSLLEVDHKSMPIRRQGNSILIGLHPGAQDVRIEWTTEEPIDLVAAFPMLTMPDEVANVRSEMQVPESRWILWAEGPQRGPAVRFWVILAVAVFLAWMLGQLKISPLRSWEWVLLVIGLTQVNIIASLLVVLWLFSISFRKGLDPSTYSPGNFNGLQIMNVLLTVVAVGVLVSVVTAGLLGSPRMFVVGNGSTVDDLRWFTPRSDQKLPQPWILSVSIWYYRLLMLLWALWLANSLLAWLKIWWQALTQGCGWRSHEPKVREPHNENTPYVEIKPRG